VPEQKDDLNLVNSFSVCADTNFFGGQGSIKTALKKCWAFTLF
jgi:hypothetical protein